MPAINKNLDEINESDLQHLVDEEIIENKTLEYKSELPGNTDEDKKKFLADVSSFANASGGDLIYGITENRETGKPETLAGIAIENVDKEMLRLDQIIRDGLEPRIPSSSINIHLILLKNSNHAIIIRLGKSWLGPHRISFKEWDRFYSRSNNGKYIMDIYEIHEAFKLSDTLVKQTKSFRDDRLLTIRSNKSYIKFKNKEILILHLIPYDSFRSKPLFDRKEAFNRAAILLPLHHIEEISVKLNYNNEGSLYSDTFKGRRFRKIKESSYIELYFNGIIEAAEDHIFQIYKRSEKFKKFPINEIEEELMKKLPYYFKILKNLGVNPPINIYIDIIGVRGFGYDRDFVKNFPIDKDELNLPEIVLEDYKQNLGKLLRPCFDSLWTALGFPYCPNYDGNNNWIKGEYRSSSSLNHDFLVEMIEGPKSRGILFRRYSNSSELNQKIKPKKKEKP